MQRVCFNLWDVGVWGNCLLFLVIFSVFRFFFEVCAKAAEVLQEWFVVILGFEVVSPFWFAARVPTVSFGLGWHLAMPPGSF